MRELHEREGGSRHAESEERDTYDRETSESGQHPGRFTRAMLVQRRAAAQTGAAPTGEPAHEVASEGVAGARPGLPHQDTIQRAFGRHDVSGVRAQVGGAAAEAASALGAEAYAFGDAVAFGDAPSLHTAAHEAAHVVQQRAGLTLPGGVGSEGDSHERHADAVADRVVRGESAEALLDEIAGGAPAPGVQRRAANPAGQALATQFARKLQLKPGSVPAPVLQKRTANGITVDQMRFTPNEIKTDGVTTSQASVRRLGRMTGTATVNYDLVGTKHGATITIGGLITPPAAGLPVGTDKVVLNVKAVDAAEPGAWTDGNLTMWDAAFLQAKADFPIFNAATHRKTPHITSGTSTNKFDVTYTPRAHSMTAEVRMKFAFVDDAPGQRAFNAADKRKFITALITRARTRWSGQWQFQNIREPKSIWGKLNPVSVRVTPREDNAAPHLTITVHKKEMTSNIGYGTGLADLRNSAQNMRDNAFPGAGPDELAKLNAKIPTPILFATGAAALPPADAATLAFLGRYLHAIRRPTFDLTITGHAALDATAVTVADKRRAAAAARTLSQQRATAVKSAITAGGTAQHHLTTVPKGDTGAAAAPAWDKVETVAAIHAGYRNKFDVLAHEFGHMIGLGDEYPQGGRVTGDKTQNYAQTEAALGHDYAEAFSRVRTDSEGIMGQGLDVRPHHYVTFWEGLAAATSTAAKPVPPFGQADWKFVGV